MWGDFVDDFRRAPIPEAWKKDPEIRGVYYDNLDAASEPYKVQHAKPALKKCPRPLGEVSVLRRLQPRLRSVGSRRTTGRVPRRRRAPRSTDAPRTAVSTRRSRQFFRTAPSGTRRRLRRRRRTVSSDDTQRQQAGIGGQIGSRRCPRKAQGTREAAPRREEEIGHTMKRVIGLVATGLLVLTAACGGSDKPAVKSPYGKWRQHRRPDRAEQGRAGEVQRRRRSLRLARQGERLERRHVQDGRGSVRCDFRQRAGDVQRGPRVPALQRRQEREGALREVTPAGPEVPPRRARSSPSISTRRTRTKTRRSARSSKP